MKVIERSEGHYNAQKVQFGTVYRWCPGSVVVECDCGERPILTHSETTCLECGGEHADIVREELAARWLEDAVTHPWRWAGDREEAGLPC
jgi:hypothetical protein